MKVQVYAQNGRAASALKLYPNLSVTFEEWLIKHTNYKPFDPAKHAVIDRKGLLKFNTPVVFDIFDNESFEKCCIEYISGMTDQFAIQVFEEIISF